MIKAAVTPASEKSNSTGVVNAENKGQLGVSTGGEMHATVYGMLYED